MLIRDYIYFMPIIISNISVVSIIWALKNKNKKCNKYIIILNFVNIVYLFVISMLIHNLLPIIVDLGIIFIWLLSFFGGILYIISTIICVLKRKKLDNNMNNACLKIITILIILPIIVFLGFLFKEKYVIDNSELIISFYSKGNGGFGDSDDFVYALNDKYCKEVSVDVGSSYEYYNKIFLPKNIKRIDEKELNNKGIEIIIQRENMGDYLYIYKNKKQVHRVKLNDKYFNIELKEIFYNK